MNKVVLDTNVLVSALLANGPPAIILDLIADDKLKPFYNDFIIAEYWNVLHRPKFDFQPFQVSRMIDDIVRTGIVVEIHEPSVIKLADEDDRIFLDITKVSGAFLITGNIKHFPSEPFIMTPTNFLKAYQQVT